MSAPHLSPIQRKVLAWARAQAGNFTDKELEVAHGNPGSTYRTRRHELTDKGMLRDSGERWFDEGDKRSRILWAVTERGRSVEL